MNVEKAERQMRAAYGDAVPGSARRNARADAWGKGLVMCRHCTRTFKPDEGHGKDKDLCAEHAAALEATWLRYRRMMQQALIEIEERLLHLDEVPKRYEEGLDE